MQVTSAPKGEDVGVGELQPSPQVFELQGAREGGGGSQGSEKESVIRKAKPPVGRKVAVNGTRPGPAKRPTPSKKPSLPGSFRPNSTRVVPGARKVVPLKKNLVGERKKPPAASGQPKPGVPDIRDGTGALTWRDPSDWARTDANNPAVKSGTDSDTNRLSSLEEPAAAAGSREGPDVGMVGPGNQSTPATPEPSGPIRGQEKKCLNKIKVTHIRLPLKYTGSGCRAAKTPGSSDAPDYSPNLRPLDQETDLDYTPDPLHKLLTDTFESLNITTFSVHLSKSSDGSGDADTLRRRIIGGLKPLTPPLITSQSSSSPSSSPSSSSEASLPESKPTAEPPSVLLTNVIPSSPDSSPSPPSSSPSSSSSEGSESKSDEQEVEDTKTTTDVPLPEDQRTPPTGKGGEPFYRRTPGRPGYTRRLRPNFGPLQNKTHPNFRKVVQRVHPRLTETGTTKTPTDETLASQSSSGSEESSSVEVNAPVKEVVGQEEGATTPKASGVLEPNNKKSTTDRGRIPVRRPLPNGGYVRRPFPNLGPHQNRTRPYMRRFPPPSRPSSPATETREEQVSSPEVIAPSSPLVSKEPEPEPGPGDENEVSTMTRPAEVNQTLRESERVPSPHRPNAKAGYYRRTKPYGGPFQNRTRPNLRPLQNPQRGPVRKTFQSRNVSRAGSTTPTSPDNELGVQDSGELTQVVQIRQPGDQNTVGDPSHDSTGKLQPNKLERNDPEEETQTLDSDSHIHKDRLRNPNRAIPDVRIKTTTTSRETTTPGSDAHKDPVHGGRNVNKLQTVEMERDGGSIQFTRSGEEQTRTLESDSIFRSERLGTSGNVDRDIPSVHVQTTRLREDEAITQYPGSNINYKEVSMIRNTDSTPIQNTRSVQEDTRSSDTNSIEPVSVGGNAGRGIPDSPEPTSESKEEEFHSPGSYIPKQEMDRGRNTHRENLGPIQEARTPDSDSDLHKQEVDIIRNTDRGDGFPIQTTNSGKTGTNTLDSPSDLDNLDFSAGRNTHKVQVNELDSGDSAPIKTTKVQGEETRTRDPIANIPEEEVDSGSNNNRGNIDQIQTIQSGEEEIRNPYRSPYRRREKINVGRNLDPTQKTKSGEEETRTPDSHSDLREQGVNTGRNTDRGVPDVHVQTTRPREEETGASDPNSGSDVPQDQTHINRRFSPPVRSNRTLTSGGGVTGSPRRINVTRNNGPTTRGRPYNKQTSPGTRPVTPPNRKPPTRRIPVQRQTQTRPGVGPTRDTTRPNVTAGRLIDRTRVVSSKPGSSSGGTREPLDYVGVRNQTSGGFSLVWDSPEGKYKNFVVTRKEVGKDETPNKEDDEEEEPRPTKDSIRGSSDDENRVPESPPTGNPQTGSDPTFRAVVPGSARSFRFDNLPRLTDYTVTLLGKGPGLLSRLHKLVISTGPEPPTDIVFSEVTENSLTVSWTKPKSPVSGFKVTYTHTEEGEPVSVALSSSDSSVDLSQLSPGSSYEVSIISLLELDESDAVKETVSTLPDPPTDLRAVNVTDSTALLLWRPALATVDKYAIVYGAGTDSELRVTVSGNSAEQQLSGLEGSTTYTVTISSQQGAAQSRETHTTFTTRGPGSDGDGPRDLQATNVTPRTALLSWKPPPSPAGSYRLTYQSEGQEMKEVIVGAMVTEYNLTRLHPGSEYMVQLQAETGGRYTSAISTQFTTGSLRFPFPSDCSQELLNGVRTSGEVEVFPQGRQGPSVTVYCDMETDGGGWTVFQRRKDGSVNFFRGWKDYQRGFGDVSGEFWLGLDSIHNLTAASRMSLRVDLRDQHEAVYAKYSTFEVGKRNYRLTVGGYSGTAGDSLTYHNNRIFSTRDRDPAPFITRCAMSYRGGWWYKNCHEANLNGLYGIDVKHQGVIWTSWKGKEFSVPFTEMKMRPAAFRG